MITSSYFTSTQRAFFGKISLKDFVFVFRILGTSREKKKRGEKKINRTMGYFETSGNVKIVLLN